MFRKSHEAASKMNKICLVTGSSTGLGADMVLKFAHECAEGVVLHGRQMEKLNQMKQKVVAAGLAENKILIVPGEITDENVRNQLVDETIKKFGRLDILVNNAGITKYGGLEQTDLKFLDDIWQVNFRSLVDLTKKCLPHLAKSKGSIINISSGLGLKATTTATYYSSLKAGLDHFTRCLAVEVGPQEVRVNSVNPGYVAETELGRGERAVAFSDTHFEAMKLRQPLRRFATSEEVAEAVYWLAVKATGTTGICLSVDCGSHIA